jgi:hypothetical protein
MGKRLFTDSEIKEMEALTRDLIIEAIDAGDLEKAKKLTHRMYNECFRMHGVFRDWIAGLLSFIGRHLGDEGLCQALQESMEASMDHVELQRTYEKEDVRGQVLLRAGGLRGHLEPLIIKEDDEKISIAMNPCGSGGRAVMSGSYGPPKNFLIVKGAQKMTFGKSEMPVYCCHCAFTNTLPMESTGYPIWVKETPEDPGVKLCWNYIYKDKRKIPSKYWERFGMKKPTR